MTDEFNRASARSEVLLPYVPPLVSDWLSKERDVTSRRIRGSLVFVDITGFTALSERLARQGRQGAETLTEAIDATFAQLIAVADAEGGTLMKFGGDALLLLFDIEHHEIHACRAAVRMRRLLRSVGRLEAGGRRVALRVSVGVHSGIFDLFLVGSSHRELLVTGPAATKTVLMEGTAEAGDIVVSRATAAGIPPDVLGEPKGGGFLLRREPPSVGGPMELEPPDVRDADVSVAIPEAVRDHLSGGTIGPEHRRAAVAFVHFDGTDEMVATRGSSTAAETLDGLVRTVQAAASRHAVTFLGSDIDRDGGKLILVGGVPTATGDDEERTLLAVRDIIDGFGELPVRIGVNAGDVFAGDVGPPSRRTYTIMGDTVNLAARMMARARPGEILATESALRRARDTFECSPIPPFQVKGKAEPVHAFVVGSVVEADRHSSGADRMPLIGRGREVDEFDRAIRLARDGNGQVVDVVGEAGIGKSRLLDEVSARAEGLAVLHTTCRQHEVGTPYAPIRRLLGQLLDLRAPDAEDTASEIRERLRTTAPQLLPWVPLLAVPLDLPMAPTPEVAALDEEFRSERLAELTAGVFAAAAATPTLLTVEDVQWMDESSGLLMSRIAEAAGSRPWVVVTTRRRVEGSRSPVADAGPTVMPLGPLSPDECVELVEAASAEAPLSPHDAAEASRRSGGNPLFLRELVLAAGLTGGLQGLPDSAEALITARIDRLPPRERSLLRQASVLGAEFDFAILGSLVGQGDLLEDDGVWHRLRDFLWRRDGKVGFHQTLLRDVAYAGLPFRTRRDLHARVGEAIYESSGSKPEERAEALALHFYEGRRFDDAWEFARLAGDRSRARSAHVEAARFYEQAIQSARFVTRSTIEELGEVFESLGDVRKLLGEFPAAERAFRQRKRLLRGRPLGEARLQLKLAWVAEQLGRYPTALRRISNGIRLLGNRDDPAGSKLQAQLAVAYAAVLQRQGRHHEAIRWSRRGAALADAANDLAALAHAYSILDWALVSEGRSEDNEFSWKALQVYEELGDLGRQALLLNNLGAFAYFRGRWDEALELYERGRAARERTGDAVNAAYGTFNVAEILSDQGRLDEAEPLLRQALRVWRAAGHRDMVALALSQLGRVASRAGRFDEALGLFDQASVEFLEIGDREGSLETDARIAECRLFQGRPDEAIALAEEALALAHRMGGVNVQAPMLHRIRGEALARTGDRDGGRAALEESLRLGRSRKAEYEVALTLRALSLWSRDLGRVSEEMENEAAAIMAGLGVVGVPGSAQGS